MQRCAQFTNEIPSIEAASFFVHVGSPKVWCPELEAVMLGTSKVLNKLGSLGEPKLPVVQNRAVRPLQYLPPASRKLSIWYHLDSSQSD
jgi:hypothetical protein